MNRQPRGDSTAWDQVLAHRPPDVRGRIAGRFADSGITPGQVMAVLADGGDALYGAALTGGKSWPDSVGGPLAVALLAAEVSAFTAHLTSRASAVRAVAVDMLLDEYSAVTVAARLGISRQKVYDISRGSLGADYIDHVPWRQS